MNGQYCVLVLYIGIIWLAALGHSKLIENETFVRSVRNLTFSTGLDKSVLIEIRKSSSERNQNDSVSENAIDQNDLKKTGLKLASSHSSNKYIIQPRNQLSKSNHQVTAVVKPLWLNNISNENDTNGNPNYSIDLSKNLAEAMVFNAKETLQNKYLSPSIIPLERKVDLLNNYKDKSLLKEPRLFHSSFDPFKSQISRSSIEYINYKQAYGIRYDPNKVRRSFNFAKDNQTQAETTTAENVQVTTISADVVLESVESVGPIENENTSNMNENLTTQLPPDVNYLNEIYEAETENSSLLVSTSAPLELLETLPNATLANNTSTTNIMIPSRVQTTIQLIKNRVKHLFTYGLDGSETNKNGQRFLNIFNVIKFQNVPCSSQKAPLTSLNGTCYNQDECDRLGGVAVDGCAGGFGVCCIFQYGCGGVTRQNISYFKSPDYPAAYADRLSCALTLVLWPNVKSVFVEFIFFELLPPSDGSCVDDQFVITGQSINHLVPIFCGINSGQHIYLDVEDSVDRQVTLSVITRSAAPRAFNIRMSQLQDQLPPQGCMQYYKETTGFVQTFNYEDAAEIVQLRRPTYYNNLNYAICIRRSPGYCVVTYSNEIGGTDFKFQLINIDEEGSSVIPVDQAGAEIYNCADDYIAVNGIRLCGDRLNDGSYTEDFTLNALVGDYSAGPIVLPVRTNADTVGRGFKLYYEQQPC